MKVKRPVPKQPNLRAVPSKAGAVDSLFVLGLGNPGARFEGTRHNVGFRTVDILLGELALRLRRRLFSPLAAARIQSSASGGPHPAGGAAASLILLRWGGFMNHSGAAVPHLKRRYRLNPGHLLVVVDNMDLPPGRSRLRMNGGDAGHNGLKSLIAAWGGGGFRRLYIGVGRPSPGTPVVEHVLGRPEGRYAEAVEAACARAARAILSTQGVTEGDFAALAERLRCAP